MLLLISITNVLLQKEYHDTTKFLCVQCRGLLTPEKVQAVLGFEQARTTE